MNKKLKVKKDDFLKGAFMATFCLILTKILGVLYVIPFYAIVGSRGSVLYGSAYNIYAIFLDLSTLGLPLAISKMVSEYSTLDYRYIKRKAYKFAAKFMVIASIITTVALFILAPLLAERIIKVNVSPMNTIAFGTLNYSAGEFIAGKIMVNGITSAIRVCSTAIFFVTLLSMTRGYLQGMKYITVSSVSQVMEQFVRVVVIILGSYLCIKVFGTTIAFAVSVAIFGATMGAIVAYIYLLRKKKEVPEDNLDNYEIKEEEKNISNKDILNKIVSYTIPFVFMQVIGSSFSLVDMFTVVDTLTKSGKFTGTSASEILNIVTTLGNKLNVIVTAIASGIVVSLLPNLTSDYVRKDMDAVRNKINRTLQITIYITVPMAVGLSLLAVPVWNVFYGNSFYGPKVFMVSIYVSILASVYTNIVVVMQSLNRYKTMYISLSLGLLFNACTNIFFMNLFDKVGLPMYYGNLFATMLGYIIILVMCLTDLKKTFKLSYKQTIIDTLMTIFATIIMSTVIVLLQNIIPFNNLSRMMSLLVCAVYAIVGVLVYGLITYKLGMYDRIVGFKLKKHEKRENN